MANTLEKYLKGLNQGYETPDVTLSNMGYKPLIFTPTEAFNPAQYAPDTQLLVDYGKTVEERENKTNALRVAIAKTLSEAKLNKTEDRWKQNYVDAISARIDDAAKAGNYSRALEVATQLAGEVATDPALQTRISHNERYETEINRQKARVDKGEVSKDAYEWWLKQPQNIYSHKDITDEYGNVVSSEENEFKPLYEDVNFAEWANTAYRLITPDKNSTSISGSNSFTNATGYASTIGSEEYKAGEARGSSWQQSDTYEKVTAKAIADRMEEFLNAIPDGRERFIQSYNVAADKANQFKEQLDVARKSENTEEYNKLLQMYNTVYKDMFKNGSVIDPEEYFARNITDSLYAKGLAYDWRTKYRDNRSTGRYSDPSRIGPYRDAYIDAGGGIHGSHSGTTTSVEGPSVQLEDDPVGKAEHEVEETPDRLDDIMY